MYSIVLFLLICSLHYLTNGDEIRRLRSYLTQRTEHGRPGGPDYFGATEFLNETIASLLPTANVRQLTYVTGKPVLLITLEGSDSSLESVLLNSHIDVVPADASSWKSGDPFTPVDSERIYARGSQDMKSVGMQYLEALAVLTKNGWKPKRTIHVSFVPDEEIGGFDGMEKLVKSEEWPSLRVGLALDEGSPNPESKYNVYVGERRTWWLAVRVEGAPGHGATFPQTTASQIAHEIIGRALQYREKQRQRLEKGDKLGDVVGLNLVFMEAGYPDKRSKSGYIGNMIPNVARFGFDIRVPPTVKEDEMDNEVTNWLSCGNEICDGVTWIWTNRVHIADVTDLQNESWFKDSFFNGLKSAGIRKEDLDISIFEAATDARLVRSVGVPAIGFSPITETPNLLHKHDEYIKRDGYIAGIRIYEHLIKSLADADADAVGDTEPKSEL